MKRHQLPYVALFIGIGLFALVLFGGRPHGDQPTTLPLLTLLLVSEFAFVLSAIATWFGVQHLRTTGFKPLYAAITGMCALLAIRFATLGIGFFPSA